MFRILINNCKKIFFLTKLREFFKNIFNLTSKQLFFYLQKKINLIKFKHNKKKNTKRVEKYIINKDENTIIQERIFYADLF